jgi:4-hydroxybenzoate polyprenyltransferase
LLPLAIKAIKGENRYNINKAGIIKGIEDNGLVVKSTNKRFIQKKHSRSKAWTSFIKSINATGKALYPLVIWKGKLV